MLAKLNKLENVDGEEKKKVTARIF